MKALAFTEAGEPAHVLRLVEIPRPQPKPGELVVKVAARPIHPADLAFIRGKYRIRPSYPQVADLEGDGVVVDGGDLAQGTRVAFRWPGTWADFAVIPLERAIVVPPRLRDDVACQISLNQMTAWGLLDEARVGAGDTVLLTAGASAVSNLVAEIARRRKIRVIGLVRGDAAEAAKRAEADQVLSVSDPELIGKLQAAAGESRVAALLDSVGGPATAKLFEVLAPGAHIIAYGVQDNSPAAVTNAALVYGNLTWKGFGIDRWLSTLAPDAKRRMLDELWAMIEDGSLSLPVAARHPLADFQAAIAEDAAHGRIGKVLLETDWSARAEE
jgi:NADPH:quinone reductase